MKLIVGLGNPGREYEGTRHNLGFEVIDGLAGRWKGRLKAWKGVSDLMVASDRQAILAKPTTFMNLSGEAVRRIADFHQIEPADLLVVVDDVNLPLGRLRIRQGGSAGGHNGLKSVIQHLGSDAFPRLRIGVGAAGPERDLTGHVLGQFRREEQEAIDQAVGRAADAAELFLERGIVTAMNRFNAPEDKAVE